MKRLCSFKYNIHDIVNKLYRTIPLVPTGSLTQDIAQDIQAGLYNNCGDPNTNWQAWMDRAKQILSERNIIDVMPNRSYINALPIDKPDCKYIREARLKKIKAAKQIGNLYHFTSVSNLIKILESNTLKGHIDKYGYGISFTRNKNLWYNDNPVRIEIDGDNLSNQFHIEPFNFFPEDGTKGNRNESEERIWEDEISPFNQYIINIDISRSKTGGIKEQYLIDKLKNQYYVMEDVVNYIQENFGITVNIIN